jgi:hypothetical protein
MNRLLGLASAMLLTLLIVVPGVAAAEPWNVGRGEHVIIASGTDFTLPAGQSVDTLVVFSGHARVEGQAGTIFIVNGTADLVGARANGIVAIESGVALDSASTVAGDIRTIDSTITGATASTVTGSVRDLGMDVALRWFEIGSILFFVYLAFAVSLLVAGVIVAGIAGRQLRTTSALIGHEPLPVIASAAIGFVGILTAAIVAVVTVVGIPLGLGVLVLVLPGLFVAGYIVSGVWVGERILGTTSSRGVRERPYAAAAVGLAVVGVVSIIPPIGGLISFIGFGAVVLAMWRAVRRVDRPMPADDSGRHLAQTAG